MPCYMGGTWETDPFTSAFTSGFTSRYNFETGSDADLEWVITVNLLAPIRLIQRWLPALRRSPNPKIVLMGALSGRDNFPGHEVANSASQFGLPWYMPCAKSCDRNKLPPPSSIQAMHQSRQCGQARSFGGLSSGATRWGAAIPLADLLNILDGVLSLSRATCLKEIDMPALRGTGA